MNRSILLVALCALLPALSQPAFAEGEDAGKTEPHVDAEVTVSAIRQLTQMRQEILLAEDRFLAKYNELNKEREYTIKCNDEASTGTRFRKRVCRPQFVDMAMGDEARGYLGGYVTQISGLAMQSKLQGFRNNMIALARKSPELAKLAQERGDLELRYNELLRHTISGGGDTPKQ